MIFDINRTIQLLYYKILYPEITFKYNLNSFKNVPSWNHHQVAAPSCPCYPVVVASDGRPGAGETACSVLTSYLCPRGPVYLHSRASWGGGGCPSPPPCQGGGGFPWPPPYLGTRAYDLPGWAWKNRRIWNKFYFQLKIILLLVYNVK